MKVVILAGGKGTRIFEETKIKPKPLIEIGNLPILVHIMKIYSYYGFKDFIICGGYKVDLIKNYFLNLHYNFSDLEIDFKNNSINLINKKKTIPDWNVKVIDTGAETLTGGRLKKIKKYFGKNEDFFMTYGDGVSDINLKKLLKFHKKNNKQATMSVFRPTGQFGKVNFNQAKTINKFVEKPKKGDFWINIGFFVLNSQIFNLIKGSNDIFEDTVMQALIKKKQLSAYNHKSFWKSMDSMSDKLFLEKLWNSKAPWKIWND